MIDAYEQRDVAILDVGGAFLLSKIAEFVLVKIDGGMLDIMCDANPRYKEFVTMERGRKVLYLKLRTALYGIMQAALLWYETFSTCLRADGFKLNPYDPCVANKMVNGKQCTICWHVDDSKISHEDTTVVDQVIKMIDDKFGETTVHRGKKHTFLGMDLELNKDGTVELSMDDYIDECIVPFGEKMNKSPPTPASGKLFEVEESPELGEKRSEIFHHIVAKLLYVSKRVRVDISPTIAFLCTRVSKSTEQDWEKLRRLLEYLNGTKNIRRIMGSDGLSSLRTYVDAAYAVHADMRSHTGGLTSLGKGVIHTKSSKQKSNSKSSTEAELIGASDFIPWTLWLKRFLESQGYTMSRTIFYQDNESAIKMEKNGMKSCGEKSRHIKIRYFFIKDILENEDISLEHCRTEVMLADFLTKPLQGSLFRRMRDIIMGITPFPSEERVGDYRKMSGESRLNSTSEKGSKGKKNNPHKNNDVRSVRPTYADVVRKMVRFKEGERKVNKKTWT